MHGVEQPPQFHPEGDVWVHTMLLLEKLPPDASPTLAWGALLHDIGKPATFRPPDPNDPTTASASTATSRSASASPRRSSRRLRFSNEDTAQIVALVKNHMRFGDILQMRESTLKRFLRLPKFDEHLALHCMDCTSAHGDLSLYDFAQPALRVRPAEAIQPKLLVTGRELIAAGYRPGPALQVDARGRRGRPARRHGKDHRGSPGLRPPTIRQAPD